MKAICLPSLNGGPSLALDAPDLCPSEQRIVVAIALLTAERGYPPSCREVLRRCGWRSPNMVTIYLKRLISKGWLEGLPRCPGGSRPARSLVLAKPLNWRKVA